MSPWDGPSTLAYSPGSTVFEISLSEAGRVTNGGLQPGIYYCLTAKLASGPATVPLSPLQNYVGDRLVDSYLSMSIDQ